MNPVLIVPKAQPAWMRTCLPSSAATAAPLSGIKKGRIAIKLINICDMH
jgi:hypothetical protein